MSDLLNSASLVMIPSGYKEDVVYSEVPTNGNGDLTLTRASNGTRVNSAGLVEVCPWNLLQQSESIGTSPWTTPNVSVTSGQTDPNGGSTAFLVVESTDGGSLRQAITQTGQLCYSIVLKYSSGTNKKASLFCTDANQQAGFDLEFGTVAYVSGSTATIESLGNGWYKCAMTFTPSTASTLILFPNYESGVGGVFAWHPQLNIGSTAKPYFPTTDRLNVPRLTYQNGGGGCPSLLLEKQSTNLALYSEQFDDASWTKARATITANATTSPDGTTNADKFIENTANDSHAVLSAISNTSGQQYTVAIYAKAGERNWFLIYVGGGPAQGKFFNLSNGTLGSVLGNAPNDSSIIDAGNGWYRCSITYTATDASSDVTFQLATSDGTNVYTGNGTSGLFVWGIQVEQSSYPTSYIPTTSSSATRVADACFKNGITSLIGQSEGTLFAEFIFNSATFPTMVIFLTTNSSFANAVYIQTFSSDGLSFQVWSGVVNQVSINTTGLTNGQKVKVAVGYKANDFVIYINGVQKGTDTSGSLPASLNNLEIGTYLEGGSPYTYAQSINQAAVFKTRLTNAELASLTTI